MTYRGIVKNGVVVFEDGAGPPNGTPVRVEASKGPTTNGAARKLAQRGPSGGRRARPTREHIRKTFDAAFGMWQDRPDWKGLSSAEVSLRLRQNLSRRSGA
ncbi:MAG: hypothetical protein ACKVW3_09320 [Phycisphaerales bacterium]